jgi:hypothetical protein
MKIKYGKIHINRGGGGINILFLPNFSYLAEFVIKTQVLSIIADIIFNFLGLK